MPFRLAELVARGEMDASWAKALAPAQNTITALGERLQAEQAAGRDFLPDEHSIFRAFQRPIEYVRVVIVGQDPYPTPGHPIGLSFAAHRAVRPIPRSLANIYKERESDLGIPPALHADLSAWSDQGVMLLNRVLTVRAGDAGSHRGWGWEQVTDLAIGALAARGGPLVAILWGKDAEGLQSLFGDVATLVSAHPSPLSARRGFFGSRPFSRANALLEQQGAVPIDWRAGEEPQTLLG